VAEPGPVRDELRQSGTAVAGGAVVMAGVVIAWAAQRRVTS
jgi:hypothetical protein